MSIPTIRSPHRDVQRFAEAVRERIDQNSDVPIPPLTGYHSRELAMFAYMVRERLNEGANVEVPLYSASDVPKDVHIFMRSVHDALSGGG